MELDEGGGEDDAVCFVGDVVPLMSMGFLLRPARTTQSKIWKPRNLSRNSGGDRMKGIKRGNFTHNHI